MTLTLHTDREPLRERAIAIHTEMVAEWERRDQQVREQRREQIVREGARAVTRVTEEAVLLWDPPVLDENIDYGYVDARSLDGVHLRYRAAGRGAVYVVVACIRCGKPIERQVENLRTLGAALVEENAQHGVCPTEEEPAEEEPAAPERRPITQAEQALIESLIAVLRERGIPETY